MPNNLEAPPKNQQSQANLPENRSTFTTPRKRKSHPSILARAALSGTFRVPATETST